MKLLLCHSSLDKCPACLKVFQRYVLLVDGTYNVNRAMMPLYCFVVEDGSGNGRNVHYSATAEEGSVHLL